MRTAKWIGKHAPRFEDLVSGAVCGGRAGRPAGPVPLAPFKAPERIVPRRAGRLRRGPSPDSVPPRETDDKFRFPRLEYRWLSDQGGTIFGKRTAKHTRYVEQRATSANQAPVVRAVTDDVTFSTQDCVLQGNCVQTATRMRSTIHVRSLHHLTSPRTYY